MSLTRKIDQLVRTTLDDAELLQKLTAFAAEDWRFGNDAHSWGPVLYERNRLLFLPLIERHLNVWSLRGAKNLDVWMDEVEKNGDLRVYRILLQAWLQASHDWSSAAKAWARMMTDAFREAPDRAARRAVLDRFDLWYDLSDEDALDLYRVDSKLTADFVRKRLARERWYDIVYEKTAEAARVAGDDAFYFELYRLTFPRERWRKDAERLCEEIHDPARLVLELKRRHLSHPEGGVWPQDLYELAQRRGADVVPYLRRAIPDDSSWALNDEAWKGLLDLAVTNGWTEIYGLIASEHLSVGLFNELVLGLSKDRKIPESHLLTWLLQLAGAKTGFEQWQQTTTLQAKSALALYERFPELLHGPFAQHLKVTMEDDLVALAKAADARGDTPLVDQLAASAIALKPTFYYGGGNETIAGDWWYVQHYQALSARAFAERALQVLVQVQPFPRVGRSFIRKKNPLYALFFGRPQAHYLPILENVRDLLEAPNVEVQTLGMQLILQRRDETSVRIAANNVDHLLTYLLDEAPRNTRIAAFDALAVAARASAEVAAQIHDRARAALDLRRRFYPRDRLIQLVGILIAAWPELRKPSERPTLYEAGW